MQREKKRRREKKKSRCQNWPGEGGQAAGFPKRRHLVEARPRMFPLQPMSEAHERGVEHMPLQLERSRQRNREREETHTQIHRE